MTVERGGAASASNSIRSIIAGGGSPSADLGSIEYITIAPMEMELLLVI